MRERVSCAGRGREWAEWARREGARGEAGPAQGKGEERELGRAGPAWVLGLGWFSIYLVFFSFLFLIQTKFEFKYKFEFKPHSNI